MPIDPIYQKSNEYGSRKEEPRICEGQVFGTRQSTSFSHTCPVIYGQASIGTTKPANLSFVESRSPSMDISMDDFEGPDSERDPRTSLIDLLMCKGIGR